MPRPEAEGSLQDNGAAEVSGMPKKEDSRLYGQQESQIIDKHNEALND